MGRLPDKFMLSVTHFLGFFFRNLQVVWLFILLHFRELKLSCSIYRSVAPPFNCLPFFSLLVTQCIPEDLPDKCQQLIQQLFKKSQTKLKMSDLPGYSLILLFPESRLTPHHLLLVLRPNWCLIKCWCKKKAFQFQLCDIAKQGPSFTEQQTDTSVGFLLILKYVLTLPCYSWCFVNCIYGLVLPDLEKYQLILYFLPVLERLTWCF